METVKKTKVDTSVFAPLSWDDETFEKWRYIQDEKADLVAEKIIASPHHFQVYQALSNIQKNNDQVHVSIFEKVAPDGKINEEHHRLTSLLQEYFEDTSLLTYFSEHKEEVQKCCNFFFDHAIEATIVLAVRSLLKQYAAFRATNVLMFTKMLTHFPHRRILETMQFVIDVMDPKGYDPDGYALRSIQKLRLVHAMIRARIKAGMHETEDKNGWNEEWGLPINQQDMIFAVHTFSVEVIDGLKAGAEKVTDEERDNYYLTWHYIGKALGVNDEINPMNYADGKALQQRIYDKEFIENSPNGPLLSEPLLEFMDKTLPVHPNRRHIYAIIKLYNEKDHKNQLIFENILKIPISQSDEGFLLAVKVGDWLWHKLVFIRYLLTPKSKKPLFYHALAMKNFNMLRAVEGLEKTWSGKHFRITDGFGDLAARKDEEVMRKSSFLFRVAHKFVDNLEKNHPSHLVEIIHKILFKKHYQQET